MGDNRDDQPAKDSGFDLDIPIARSRREFFEQEAVVAGPPEELESDLEPDQVADALREMREEASRRTAQSGDEPPAGPEE